MNRVVFVHIRIVKSPVPLQRLHQWISCSTFHPSWPLEIFSRRRAKWGMKLFAWAMIQQLHSKKSFFAVHLFFNHHHIPASQFHWFFPLRSTRPKLENQLSKCVYDCGKWSIGAQDICFAGNKVPIFWYYPSDFRSPECFCTRIQH